MIRMSTNVEKLRKIAAAENNGVVSAGGLYARVAADSLNSTELTALGKLLELRRRDMKLDAEQLAKKAEVDLAEVVALERGQLFSPEPRTIHCLAGALKLPSSKLMQLAGLVAMKDSTIQQAAVRFAARSEPIEKLSPEEHKALEEFVRILAED